MMIALYSKRAVLEAMLDAHRAVMIHVVPDDTTVIPDRLMVENSVGLLFGHSPPIVPPTPYQIDAWGVRVTLLFSGAAFAAEIPWRSIWAITDSADQVEGTIWAEDAPPGALEDLGIGKDEAPDEPKPGPAHHLKLVD